MKTLLAAALLLHAAGINLAYVDSPHFRTPIGVSYPQSSFGYSSFHPISYSSYARHNVPYYGGIEYAPLSVKAIPAVHHLPAVADVPVTKVHAQPAVIQKEIAVAKPGFKTSTFEIRRPAIQKHFFDVEERTVVRPVGSALFEFEEPVFRVQKGPAVVTSFNHDHSYKPVTPITKIATVQPFVSTVAPPVNFSPGPFLPLSRGRQVYSKQFYPYSVPNTYTSPILSYDDMPVANTKELRYIQEHYQNKNLHHNYDSSSTISSFPVPHLTNTSPQDFYLSSLSTPAPFIKHPLPLTSYLPPASTPVPYLTETIPHPSYLPSASTPVPYLTQTTPQTSYLPHVSTAVQYLPHTLPPTSYLPSTPAPDIFSTSKIATHDDTVVVDSAFHSTAKSLDVETHSHGDSIEHKETQIPIGKDLGSAQANSNHVNFLEILTGNGPITDVEISQGEVIDDAHFSRARVLSVTPAPNHEPVHEEIKTRRIVVSRPAQTLQDVNLVEPVTNVEKVIVNEPTLVKTASVAIQRVHTSVPVIAKSFAPNYYANTHYYNK